MTIGKVEIFLIVVLIAGAAWMGSHFLPGGAGGFGSCTPIPLSPEVKAYVDAKISGGGAGQCGDMPKVLSRVSQLEGRMTDLDAYKKMREEVEEKRQELEQALAQQRADQGQILSKVRAAEVEALKTEVGRLCAGITVRSANGPGSMTNTLRDGETAQERRDRRQKERQERMQEKRNERKKAASAPAPAAAPTPAPGSAAPAAPAPAAAPAAPAPDAGNGQPK